MSWPNLYKYSDQQIELIKQDSRNCAFPTKVENGKLYLQHESTWKEVVSPAKVNEILTELYENPLTTGGRDKLFSQIKDKYVGISRQHIMAFLKNQESWQLRKPVSTIKTSSVSSIIPKGPKIWYQIDLIDFQLPWLQLDYECY